MTGQFNAGTDIVVRISCNLKHLKPVHQHYLSAAGNDFINIQKNAVI